MSAEPMEAPVAAAGAATATADDDLSPRDPSKECEYFHVVIRPMLAPGHEGELCEWMKEMGLLRRGWRCSSAECKGGGARGYMVWNKARVVDKYNWACPNCARKMSIREGSFFVHIKCELKHIFQAILGWCEKVPSDVAAHNLELKNHVVARIYERCTEVASKYVNYHNHAWSLGGENAVVVVDVFPDGYMSSAPTLADASAKKSAARKRILCIADTSFMPARIWAKILDQDTSGGTRPNVIEEALNHVTQHVRPGSTLVANDRAKYCPYDAIQTLEGYPNIISVETLIELDLPGTKRIQENLETIWANVVQVCEEVQEVPKKVGAMMLDEFMWRQLFAQTTSTALESILHHIADQYVDEE